MTEETPCVNKLPLEVMGLVLLKLGNPSERRFEEIKKCRLISPRWYKAVQDLFQDQFFQKGLTHFDGSKYTYGQSRRFGLNIFESFPLNFATFKISRSQLYLMSNFLPRLISTNLQNLVLQDNQMNLKELLEVLKMFPNIVKLEFVQSHLNIDVMKKMCQIYANPGGKSDAETIEFITNELAGTENFLRNLKMIDFEIVHGSILNFLILLISCSNCELEEILIVFNLTGIKFSVDRLKSIQENEINFKNLELGPVTKLNKFSKSLKKIKIFQRFWMSPAEEAERVIYLNSILHLQLVRVGRSRMDQSILNIFNGNQLKDLNNIEELQINIFEGQFSQNESIGLLDFIKYQNKLKKAEVGAILESFSQNQGHGQENGLQLKKAFLESLCSLGVKVWCEVSEFGLDALVQFPENLVRLDVNICPTSNWRFSDVEFTFLNCESLILSNFCPWNENNNHWPNFEVPVIAKKFPNLKILNISDTSYNRNITQRPQVSNEDLQSIIQNYPKLENLSLFGCIDDLDDSGLTGLTSEALTARKNSPYLPITPEERTGLPISHLKNLAKLVLFKKFLGQNHSNPHKITDLTPLYGFEHENSKFKSLCICNSNITDSGVDVLKRKLPSSCRLSFN